VHEKPGTADLEQAPGFVPAAVLAVAALLVLARETPPAPPARSAPRLTLAPFDARDHVLRGAATRLAGAHQALAPRITPGLLDEVLGLVPGEWLGDGRPGDYAAHLLERAPRVLEVIQ